MIYPDTEQTSASVAQHYNSLDSYYRKLWGEHVHHGYWETGQESVEEATEKLIHLIAEGGQVGVDSVVCDIGCGYGGTSRFLVDNYGAHVTGLTISQAQIDYAKTIDPSVTNPTYLCQDFLQNTLPNEHFDVVLSIESSEHMPDKEKFFEEVYRILKPGGRFVNCVWLAAESPSRRQIKHLLEPICREGRLPSMGNESEYRTLMQNSGLSDIEFRDLSENVKRTWKICAKRAAKAFLKDAETRSYLLDKQSSDRVFAKTLLRIWSAYQTKAMRYGLFTARKPHKEP